MHKNLRYKDVFRGDSTISRGNGSRHTDPHSIAWIPIFSQKEKIILPCEENIFQQNPFSRNLRRQGLDTDNREILTFEKENIRLVS